MRRPIFFACWKANKTPKEVLEFYTEIQRRNLVLRDRAEVCLAPCHTYLELSKVRLPKPLSLASQDVCDLNTPGRMGEVTANILKEYGVKYCAIGHREKREQGETDTIINSKVKRLMENGITPMICIGDSDSENENGLTKDVLRKQLQGTLVGVPNIQDVLICYRPSWTLGTGKVARGEYVNMIGEYVREIVSEITDNPLAKSCCFIYGGGISGANVEDYMKQVEIDGVFFVGASLKPDDFCEVLKKGGVLQ